MNLIETIFALVVTIFAFCNASHAGTDNGTPVKYITSCEIDLNGDDKSDIALLIESVRGRELIVLLRTDNSYDAHLISSNVGENMFMSCHFGKTIRGIADSAGSKDVVCETPGAYVELYQPEGASVAYYWNGSEFKEVWLSD
jgi:hypothetical protein